MENSSPSAISPNYPTLWKSDSFRWGPFLAVVGVVAFLFLIVLSIIIVAYMFSRCTPFDPVFASCAQQALTGKSGITFELIAQGAVEVVAVIVLLLMLPWVSKLPLRDLGFRAISGREVGIALLGAVAMVIFVNGLGTLMQAATKTHEQQLALKILEQLNTPSGRVLAFLTAAVVAPVFEELSFRVFIFNFVLRRSTFWTAAIVSAILFGLAHITAALSVGQLTTIIPLMVGGLILARVYYTTRNAYASMLTHAVFNSVSLLGLFFAPNLVK
ncbi:MAG: CPBP family intramembrane metalloprotease [Candidatus Eremiobacteraeota bacterium]|nr:CPBP family intramembrane metalloprotease [Candidatus Eremiobacteraeota bacterium]